MHEEMTNQRFNVWWKITPLAAILTVLTWLGLMYIKFEEPELSLWHLLPIYFGLLRALPRAHGRHSLRCGSVSSEHPLCDIRATVCGREHSRPGLVATNLRRAVCLLLCYRYRRSDGGEYAVGLANNTSDLTVATRAERSR
jgi:hypothetical protein